MSAALARPEIAALTPYETARQQDETLRLNANELPEPPAPAGAGLNRYPPIRPEAIEADLAPRLGVEPDCLLVTRGSSEAIDLLVRTFCRAYRDDILVMPPTFAMYRVYADMQAAAVREVPLLADRDFAVDVDGVLAACADTTKLVFACSPNNPTGGLVPRRDIEAMLAARRGRSLVAVDEAYVEFSGRPSLASAVRQHDNLVVLRTLSKAWGLAGTRCGAVIAAPEIIGLLRRMLPPYAFSTPATQAIRACIGDAAEAAARRQVASIVAERDRLAAALPGLPGVERVWPSFANFLLVRFADLDAVQARLAERRILIRAYAGSPLLAGSARITVGGRAENDRLLEALAAVSEAVT